MVLQRNINDRMAGFHQNQNSPSPQRNRKREQMKRGNKEKVDKK
jgi:hypothetical protein